MPGPPTKPSTPRWLDIVVHDLHVDLKIAGVTVMTSENYASPAKARRAARTILWAINYRPARMIWWMGRAGNLKRHVYRVRHIGFWQAGNQPIAVPSWRSEVGNTLRITKKPR